MDDFQKALRELRGPDAAFDRQVYAIVATIPAGLGLACHRVVNRTGALSPDYAFGGPGRQRERLEAEGITFLSDGRIDMVRHQWQENEQLTFG